MTNSSRISEVFAGHQFGAPASVDLVRDCESRLGHPIPAPVRQLYLAFDGFRGPTDSRFFYSLEELLEVNVFLRSGEFPAFLEKWLAVGDPGTGSYWIVPIEGRFEVREWDAEWGEDVEVLVGDLVDVWAAKKQLYDSFDEA